MLEFVMQQNVSRVTGYHNGFEHNNTIPGTILVTVLASQCRWHDVDSSQDREECWGIGCDEFSSMLSSITSSVNKHMNTLQL